MPRYCVSFFFFNDTATTEIYTLSLHDALPILQQLVQDKEVELILVGMPRNMNGSYGAAALKVEEFVDALKIDRKSTRLNSSHSQISYAVFCLKKKKNFLPVGFPGQYTGCRCRN